MSNDDQPYFLDPVDVGRAFSRIAPGYDASAVLQARVREQLLERLDYVALAPAAILDAGCGTGSALASLRGRYPDADLIGADIAPGMLAEAGPRAAACGARLLAADGHALPLGASSVDMVFSNLMLPYCHDPETVLREFRRVLSAGGLLSFATFGPDTLRELRDAWARTDRHVHVNYFYDMHDIGDALQRAGFAGPVLDVDTFTLTYTGAVEMMRDVAAMGGGNVAAGRPRGLTGRGRFERVAAGLERHRHDGRLPATFEVIYGHAFAPERPPQVRLDDGGVAIPASGIARPRRR